MSSTLKRKLEGEVEIREAAGDVFHDFFQNKPHHLSTVSPAFIQGCDLHDGAFGTPGSKISWTYTVEGKPRTVKQILEVIDEKNKIIKFNCIEGELVKEYKSLFVTYQVIPKEKEASIVRWTFEYEKKHAGAPEPSEELDALLKLATEVDDHHHNQDK